MLYIIVYACSTLLYVYYVVHTTHLQAYYYNHAEKKNIQVNYFVFCATSSFRAFSSRIVLQSIFIEIYLHFTAIRLRYT